MSNPQLTLTIQNGPQVGRTFKLTGGTQTIGRAPGNQIHITDPTVSKQHARLTVQPNGLFIQDLGSSNGTFVNGQRITGLTPLRAGDVVQVGTLVTLGVQGPGGAVPAQATPSMATSGSRSLARAGVVAVAALLVITGIGAAAWFVLQSSQPTGDQADSVDAPATVEVIAPEEPTPTPMPEMSIDFSADKTTVQLGQCATLRWSVDNAREVRLDGENVPDEGSRKVCPQEASKTYRLTALSFAGETREQAVALTVPPTPPPPPEIEIDFAADQSTVEFGKCTTLRWSVANAQEVRLEGKKVSAAGTEQICPKEAANTYQLLVQPLEGDLVDQTVIINVPPTPMPTPTPVPTPTPAAKPQPQNPIIDKFIADQNSLNQGSCTTLRWTIRNARIVRLDGNQVANQGSQRVCPTASTNTYNLVATGTGGGSVQSSVTLAVIAPTSTPVIIVVPQPQPTPSGPPSVNVCAKPAEGICYIFQWDIQNVKEIYFDGEGVTGKSSRKVCDANVQPGEKGVLRIIHIDGHVEEIIAWPACN